MMSEAAKPQYIVGNRNMSFFSNEDIYAMFDSGMCITQISRKLSRVLGLKVSSCEKAVSLMLYNRSRNFPAPAVRVVEPVATDGFVPVDTSHPFKRVPQCWAVGDFCLRRY